MKLVVGMGNPGKRYEGTRHNVGFDVVDLLARRVQAPPAKEKFHSLVTDAVVAGDKLVMLLPQTYVNESGRAVRSAVDWFGLALDDLIVVCDDFNLPLGKLRIRSGGSGGGHNGLTSIGHSLASDGFPRLRIGIGEVPCCGQDRMDPADFVLSRFLPKELDEIHETCQRAVDAIETWMREGIETTMNFFN